MAIEYDKLHEYASYNYDVDIKLEDFVIQTSDFLDSKAGISLISDDNLAQDVLLKNKVENSNEVLSTDTGNTESCEFGLEKIETIKVEEHMKTENMLSLQKNSLLEFNQTHVNLKANKELSSRRNPMHSTQRRKDSDTVFCKGCKKMFSYYYYYNVHAKIHAGNTPYKCDICEKRFVKLSLLEKHKVAHSENKPYSCKACGKSFKKKTDVTRHQYERCGKRPFSCEQCEKSFEKKIELRHHIKEVHLVKEVHICSYCGKTFDQKRSMMDHVRLHTVIKRFTCEACKKSFTCNSLLQTHMRVHTGDYPYSCTLCPAIFTRSGSVKRHMKLHIKKEVITD